MCATWMPSRVAEAELKDLNPFICRVSFLRKLWSFDRQMNAQQSSRGVLNDVVQIFYLQNLDQRRDLYHSTDQRCMINTHAPVRHDLLRITVGHGIANINDNGVVTLSRR